MLQLVASSIENRKLNQFLFSMLNMLNGVLAKNGMSKLADAIAALRVIYKNAETLLESEQASAEWLFIEELKLSLEKITVAIDFTGDKHSTSLNTLQTLKLIFAYLCHAYKVYPKDTENSPAFSGDIEKYRDYFNDLIIPNYSDDFYPSTIGQILHDLRYIITRPQAAYERFFYYRTQSELSTLLETLDTTHPDDAIQQIRNVLDANPEFTKLVIHENAVPVQKEHIPLVLKAVLEGKTIQQLKIPSSYDSLKYLAEKLPSNENLKVFDFDDPDYFRYSSKDNDNDTKIINRSVLRNSFQSLKLTCLMLSDMAKKEIARSQTSTSMNQSGNLHTLPTKEMQKIANLYGKYFDVGYCSYTDVTGVHTKVLHRKFVTILTHFLYHIGAALINNGKAYQIDLSDMLANLSLDTLNIHEQKVRETLLNHYEQHGNTMVAKVALDHLPPEFIIKTYNELKLFDQSSVFSPIVCPNRKKLSALTDALLTLIKVYIFKNSKRFTDHIAKMDAADFTAQAYQQILKCIEEECRLDKKSELEFCFSLQLLNGEPKNQNEDNTTQNANHDQQVTDFTITDHYLKLSSRDYEVEADYCQTYQSKNVTVGTCEVQGKRGSQQDYLAVAELNQFDQLPVTEQKNILQQTFIAMHEQYAKEDEGSTGCVATAWLDNRNHFNVITANLGDSYAFYVILDENGEVKRFYTPNAHGDVEIEKLQLNKLHKLSNKDEKYRICEAYRDYDGRGITYKGKRIGMTRSFGDTFFDDSGLSHDCEITHMRKPLKTGETAFIIVACDGVESVEEKTLANIIKKHRDAVAKAANKIIEVALNKCFSGDNISAAVFKVTKTPTSAAVFDGHAAAKDDDRLCLVSQNISRAFYPELTHQLEIALSKNTVEITNQADEETLQQSLLEQQQAPVQQGSRYLTHSAFFNSLNLSSKAEDDDSEEHIMRLQ